MDMLKRDTLLFKIAYGLDDDIPAQTTTCRLSWRIVSGVLVRWPVVIFVVSLVSLIASVIGILFARRVHFGDNFNPTIPIRYWPTFLGHRIWPASILGSGWLAYLVYEYGQSPIPPLIDFWKKSWPMVGYGMLGVILLIGGILFWNSQTRWLITARIQDWKDERCRIIPIEPEPDQKN